MTKTNINYCGIDIRISANFAGYNSNSHGIWCKYRVTILTEYGKTWFIYNDSINNYNEGIRELSENGLKYSLYCMLEDAMSYNCSYNYIEFCDNLGLDCYIDNAKARRVYNACKKHAIAATKVFNGKEYDIFDELQKDF